MLDHAVEGEQDTSARGGEKRMQELKMEMQVKTSGKRTGAEHRTTHGKTAH